MNAPFFGVVEHPDNLTWEEAATCMMFVTTYGALVDIAKMQAADVMPIRTASSRLGLAAIQFV